MAREVLAWSMARPVAVESLVSMVERVELAVPEATAWERLPAMVAMAATAAPSSGSRTHT